MKPATRLQLSLMMFLEFFIWGAWFVTMNSYLSSIGASPSQIGLAYGTQALGAIIAPFIIGLIADRFFSAQYILGVLHLAGAILMYVASSRPDFESFYPILLIYMILYMPTLALVNAVGLDDDQLAKLRIELLERGWDPGFDLTAVDEIDYVEHSRTVNRSSYRRFTHIIIVFE